MGNFRCEIAEHTVTAHGLEAITFSACYERMIHADVMTYRWGRNYSSSRATPYKRMKEWILSDPAMHLHLGVGRGGMSAGALCDRPEEARAKLLKHLDYVYDLLDGLVGDHDLHKELVNRYSEPFGWINGVMTMGRAQLMNAFAQRLSPKANVNVQRLFVNMARLYRNSVPRVLGPGEWHIPFLNREEETLPLEDQLVWSVARSAWTSYRTADGRVAEFTDAKRRHDDCVALKHMTPCEHQLVARDDKGCKGCVPGYDQYRKLIPGECETCDLDALLDGPYRDADYVVG